MSTVSILNTVLGPVMRGPSSSHSAAPHAIGMTVRELSASSGVVIKKAKLVFDPSGSFAEVYTNQGSDEGFAAGLCGIPITSAEYSQALKDLKEGRPFNFEIVLEPLSQNHHPNRVDILLDLAEEDGSYRRDSYKAVSSGGGVFTIIEVNGNRANINGDAYILLLEGIGGTGDVVLDYLESLNNYSHDTCIIDGPVMIIKSSRLLRLEERFKLTALLPASCIMREASPRQHPVLGHPEFEPGTAVIMELAEQNTLDRIASAYEARVLNASQRQVDHWFEERLDTMLESVEAGLAANYKKRMKYIEPSAVQFSQSPAAREIAGLLIHTAITSALAVLELNTCRGVVCAAPTAGSSGILPGVLYSLKKSGMKKKALTASLKVMGLIGSIIAKRATFAAETSGCAAETGSAAAMAAAGLAFIYGACPSQVFDAAAICLMNTMGLICDPVGGEVEIPCHARNIGGIGQAFCAAAAAVGGFKAVIPFDEVVDSLLSVGRKTCPEFLCTARGGLSITPSAVKMSGRDR